MATDDRRLMKETAARPAPAIADLPAHITNDHTELTRRLARQLGVDVDVLG